MATLKQTTRVVENYIVPARPSPQCSQCKYRLNACFLSLSFSLSFSQFYHHVFRPPCYCEFAAYCLFTPPPSLLKKNLPMNWTEFYLRTIVIYFGNGKFEESQFAIDICALFFSRLWHTRNLWYVLCPEATNRYCAKAKRQKVIEWASGYVFSDAIKFTAYWV